MFAPLAALALACARLALAAGPLPAGGVAGPLYASWAKFPLGTSVTHRTTEDDAGRKSESATTYTLFDLSADRAVIEAVRVEVVAGRDVASPGRKQVIRRFDAAHHDLLTNAPEGAAPPEVEGLVEAGDRPLTVGGREYGAKYAKFTPKPRGFFVVTGESWTSDEVPGTTLRATTAYSGAAVAWSSATELIEVRVPAKPAPPPAKVPDPEYQSWAKFPVGTAVVYKVSIRQTDSKAETTDTHTLVELTAGKVVVEMTRVFKQSIGDYSPPAARHEIEREMYAPPGHKPGTPIAPEGLIDSCEEPLTLGGRKYTTRYTKRVVRPGGDWFVETWASDEVPGRVVKSASGGAKPGAAYESTSELVEVRVPGKK